MKIFRSESEKVDTLIIKNICDEDTFFDALWRIKMIFGADVKPYKVEYGLHGIRINGKTNIRITSYDNARGVEVITLHEPHDVCPNGEPVLNTDVIDLEGERCV